MDRPRLRRVLRRFVVYPLLGLLAALAVAMTAYVATLYTAGPAHEGELALTGATVLVGPDLEPRAGTTVLVRDGTIVEVGDDGAVDIATDTEVIDLAGHTLLPGLIDLHVHLGSPELEADEELGPLGMPRLVVDAVRFVPAKRRALLEHGVTTVRSLGDDHGWILEMRQRLADGELEGPRLFAAGPLFTTRGGHPVVTLHGGEPEDGVVRLPTSTQEAQRQVAELATGDGPVDVIKIVQDRGGPERPLEPFDADVLGAIVDEAHAHELPVVGHWGTIADLEDLLGAGVDGIEHVGRVLDGWPPALLDELLDAGVPMTPTLAVFEVADLPAGTMEALQDQVAELHDAGGRLQLGTDAGMPGVAFGPSVHRELELLVGSGLSPQEALRAATSHAAEALRVSDLGVIEPGRAADLVAVVGDPLRDIRAVRDVAAVWRDGRLVVDHLDAG